MTPFTRAVEGGTLVVVGLGSMGLLFCWLLRKRGAGRIVGIDPCAYRCRAAEEWGATRAWPRCSTFAPIHAVIPSSRFVAESWRRASSSVASSTLARMGRVGRA